MTDEQIGRIIDVVREAIMLAPGTNYVMRREQAAQGIRAVVGQHPGQSTCKGDPGECAYNGACMYACGSAPSQSAGEPVARVNKDGFIVEIGLSLSPGMLLYASPPPTDAARASGVTMERDPLSDFQEGQWWVAELDAMVKDGGTADEKRAVAVVHRLLRACRAVAEPDATRVEADRREPMTKQQREAMFAEVQRRANHLTDDGRYSFGGWFPIAVDLIESHHGIRPAGGAYGK